MITVQVWSDYVCPFCYIGKRQLEKAIEETGLTGQVHVEFKAFELDATTPKDAHEPVVEALARKYNTTPAEAKKMTDGVAARAQEVGLTYNFDAMLNQNTLDAHRLMKLAEEQSLDAELGERLMKAYFIEGQAIAQHDVLLALATEVGLAEADVRDVLQDSTRYVEAVEYDKEVAQQLQVRGVPFFVLDNKYGIAGAQPQELFNDTLRKVAAEAGVRPRLQQVGDNANICGDDGCSIDEMK